MKIPARSEVETSFGRLAYRRAGTGRAVVLIHGSLVTADDMVIALMRDLADSYDVIAFDRPGHGGSQQTIVGAGAPYTQAEALAAGWRALGIERPLVIGHSFGATVSLCMALKSPRDISGVIAISPLCFAEPRIEQMLFGPRAMPIAGKIIAETQGRQSDLALLPLLRHAMFLPQTMPTRYAEAYPFEWSSSQEMMIANGLDSVGASLALMRSTLLYASCRVPVRILGGTHDIVVTNARHGCAAALMMPQAHFEWLIGAGHMSHHFHQASHLSDAQSGRCECPLFSSALAAGEGNGQRGLTILENASGRCDLPPHLCALPFCLFKGALKRQSPTL